MLRPWTWRQKVMESPLPSTTKLVLLVLSSHMNDMGEPAFPSQRRLADLCSLSERAIITHIQVAVEHGWLRCRKRGMAGQKWASNEYEAAWPKGVGYDAERGEPRSPQETEGVNDVHVRGEPRSCQGVNDVHTNTPVLTSHLIENTPLPPKGDGEPMGQVVDVVVDRDGEQITALVELTPAGAAELEAAQDLCGFAEFWEAYPRAKRHNKAKCREYWRRGKLSRIWPQIVQAVELWKRSKMWNEKGGQFICWPQKFLSERRWEQEDVQAMMVSTAKQATTSDLLALQIAQAEKEEQENGNR